MSLRPTTPHRSRQMRPLVSPFTSRARSSFLSLVLIMACSVQALEAQGVPSLYLKEQPYLMADQATVRAAVAGFVRTLGGVRV